MYRVHSGRAAFANSGGALPAPGLLDVRRSAYRAEHAPPSRRFLRPRRALLRIRERGLAHPCAVLPRQDAGTQPIAVARTVAFDYVLELVPVDRTEIVVATFVVPLEERIGHPDAQVIGLRNRLVDKALPQLVVGQYLDLPLRRLRAVHALGVGRSEHHQRRPPPAVERVLGHRLLLGRSAAKRHHDVEALPLVEALFLADADHRPRVRPERAPAQGNLVHDRRAVDQPADGADVRPGERRIVEDARVLGLAGVQVGDELIARDAERFRRRVEVEAVARLVLHLGHQDRLALQARRSRDPVALWQHADDLRVRVLRDLPDQGPPIGLGHPVLGLDLDVGIDALLEGPLLRRHLVEAAELLRSGIDHLRVHRLYPPATRLAGGSGNHPKTIHFFDGSGKVCIMSAGCGLSVSRAPASQGGARRARIDRWIRREPARAPLKAKSVVVTVWGDAIAPHGGAVWLSGLIRLLAPLGLNERLVRTSVYRLVQEGWLTARQDGRRSLYRLTAAGLQRFEHAYR